MAHSTPGTTPRKRPVTKAKKARSSTKKRNLPTGVSDDFPLSVHKGTGYWTKKVRGRPYYFGRVADDPKGVAALRQWLEEKDDLLAGREPRAKTDGLTVRDLANKFMIDRDAAKASGEISPRTWVTYYSTCKELVRALGRDRAVAELVPDDFRKLRGKLERPTRDRRRGATALRNIMQRVRSVFKFAFDDGLIDRPVRFGAGFRKPKPDVIDRAREAHRAQHGPNMFEAADIRLMLDALNGKEVTIGTDELTGEPKTDTLKPSPGLRAMVLLAANCAFGQSDLANLPTRAVDLQTGWIDFARTKTGQPRKIPLWPETIAAIRAWLKVRPTAKDKSDGHLLFLTRSGRRFLRLNEKGHHTDGIGQEFQKLIARLGLKRPRIGIYSLRHGFETIAGETTDQAAVNAIMGHKDRSMAAHYRERIAPERLQRVAEHVRAWVFAKPIEQAAPPRVEVAEQPASPPKPERRAKRQRAASTTPNDRPRLRIVG
jgi:integrase